MSFGQRVDWYIDNNNDIKPALQGTPLSSPVFASGVVSGGDAVLGNQVAISAPAGKGVRQGAENVQITRSLGADFTWDGNPDCAIKAIARNYAANTTNQGAERGIDIQARNSGTNISWVNAANFNARNDSGKTADQLLGIGVRVEDYGTVSTSAIGLDVNMSIENATGSPSRHGIQVRNTDQSGQSACTSVMAINQTSTNGFIHFLDLTNLATTASTMFTTSGTDATTFAGRIRILMPSGSPAWINVYSTSNA